MLANSVEIIVGSQMGSAEYVADRLAELLNAQGYQAQIHLTPDLNSLNHNAEQCWWLIVTSTYGAGDLPDNLQGFWQQLSQQPTPLQIKFAAVGLGDRSYDTYNQAIDTVTQQLLALGAEAILDTLKINVLEDELAEDQAEIWFHSDLKAHL